jgi:putative ABC transport system substrate-binding protein
MIRRREFIAGLGGAVAWPAVAHAQQRGGVRRIGVLTLGIENDKVNHTTLAVFREGLAKLGWVEERNLRIDLRFGGAEADRFRTYAAVLVSLNPDLIVVSSGAAMRACNNRRLPSSWQAAVMSPQTAL